MCHNNNIAATPYTLKVYLKSTITTGRKMDFFHPIPPFYELTQLLGYKTERYFDLIWFTQLGNNSLSFIHNSHFLLLFVFEAVMFLWPWKRTILSCTACCIGNDSQGRSCEGAIAPFLSLDGQSAHQRSVATSTRRKEGREGNIFFGMAIDQTFTTSVDWKFWEFFSGMRNWEPWQVAII